MVSDIPPREDPDDPAVLGGSFDDGYHDGDDGGYDVVVLDHYDSPRPHSDTAAPRPDDSTEQHFTVANPPGSVTVTAVLDGRVRHVELTPEAGGMTEPELADEIVVIANLATMAARSAQYVHMLDAMRAHGHSDTSTRDFLTRDLDLPSPEQTEARRAEIFARRYGHTGA